MRISSQLGYVLSGTATLALLAGCAGGGAGTPAAGIAPASTQSVGGARPMSIGRQPSLGHSVLRPDIQQLRVGLRPGNVGEPDAKASADVFISDAGTNDVYVYSAAGKLSKTLTGFNEPQGLATDKSASLYIADTGNSQIVIYPKGYTKSSTLSDPGQYPVGVAVDSKGDLGVTNIISTSDGPGSVTFYKKGAKKPEYTVSTNDRVYFGAFDKAGNFYFDGSDNSTGAVVVGEIKAGKKTVTPLTTSNAITFPGGVQVNTADKLVIDDQESAAAYTYNLKGTKLTVTTTTALTGSSDPVTIALTSTDKDLWTADAGLAASNEYAYPKGGSPVKTISGLSEPIGVAVTPDEIP